LAALALLGGLLPDSEALWRRLHGLDGAAGLVFFEEDGTGVVALTPEPGGQWRLSVNGKGNSWLPYGRGHTVLGAVPASVHPAPRRVAIVGLGSGDTVWAASYRPETVSTTVFEISRPQPRVLWRFLGLFDMLELRYLLEDSRLRIRLEDGRKALAADADTYDIVEADATWPQSAGSGNLYSLEFFRTVARRLAEGGLMCTWAPTPRVSRTFRTVFPHVVEDVTGTILVGSLQPIPVEPEAWMARVAAGEAYLGATRADEVRKELQGLRPASRVDEGDLNRDLFPRDELAVPQ
jgi:spermidine synthase